jgi:hypothetical protein
MKYISNKVVYIYENNKSKLKNYINTKSIIFLLSIVTYSV